MLGRTARTTRLRVAGVAFAATALLAAGACGGDDDDTGGGAAEPTVAAPEATGGQPAEPEEGEVDPEGVLRYGYDLMGSGELTFDPAALMSPVEGFVLGMVYDSLLRQGSDGSYEPGLAEEATIVDPSTIDVRLRPGLTFSDGSPLDAEAVKFTIERNVASENRSAFRMAELSQVSAIEVKSPTELTIRLATPVAGAFYNLLAHVDTFPISRQAVESGVDFGRQPVGAGPFEVVSFDPSRSVVLRKRADYFQADQIRLAGIELVQMVDGPPMVNAMRSNAVDTVTMSPQLLGSLEGGNIETRSVTSGNTVLWISIQCPDDPLLSDVRVRQALNFALDRDALNQAVYEGRGEPQWGWWNQDSPFFDPDLEGYYARDVERARSLLADAGATSPTFSLMVSPDPLSQRFAEIVQSQWAEAGITAELVPTTNPVEDYYLGDKGDMFVTPQSRTWTDKMTRNFMPGSVGNTCEPDAPEFTAAVDELRGLDPADPQAVELWHEAQRHVVENAWGVLGLIGTQANAWNTERVGGVQWVPNVVGHEHVDYRHAFIKA